MPMSIKMSKESKNCVVIKVSGILSFKELQSVQETAKGMLSSDGKINCLILAKQFSGWGKDGDWGDLTFLYESDPYINKIAVVADNRRKDELLMFLGAGRRQAAVEFFSQDEEDEAQCWLAESAE